MAGREKRRKILTAGPTQRLQGQENHYTLILRQLNLLLDICGFSPDSQTKSSLFAMSLEQLKQYADKLLRKKGFWRKFRKNSRVQAIRRQIEKCLENSLNNQRHRG